MMRSSIDSLIKLPLQIPFETNFQSKEEDDIKNPTNKTANKNEASENTDEDSITIKLDDSRLLNGYIKYPKYDFF